MKKLSYAKYYAKYQKFKGDYYTEMALEGPV